MSDFSDLKIIKERLLNDGRVEELLDIMGCEHISHEQGGELVVAQLPKSFKSNNKRSVQVKLNNDLSSTVRSRSVSGDIYAIVSYIINKIPANETQDDLKNAKNWIIEVMGYHDILDGRYKAKGNKGKKINSWLKDVKKQRTSINWDDVKPNTPLDEKIISKYILNPYLDWIEEGISWETQVKYQVGYDLWSDRVTIPIRNKNGELTSIKGRYVGDNKEILDRYKYIYLYKVNKSVELFNLDKALPYIQKHKKVIVFEGAKSCMKADSMNIFNTVSIEGDEISPVQVSLLKELGIDVEIILAFDKDRMLLDYDDDNNIIFLDEPKEYPVAIMEQAEKITNRNVYTFVDHWNILDIKDAPIDKGVEVFIELYKRKTKLPIANIFSK